MKNTKYNFECLMLTKLESDHKEKNPNENMAKISFRIPQSGLNVLDFMAKTLDSTRQDVLNEILKVEIEQAYIGMTSHLEMSESEWLEHFTKVCSGELKDGHNA